MGGGISRRPCVARAVPGAGSKSRPPCLMNRPMAGDTVDGGSSWPLPPSRELRAEGAGEAVRCAPVAGFVVEVGDWPAHGAGPTQERSKAATSIEGQAVPSFTMSFHALLRHTRRWD